MRDHLRAAQLRRQIAYLTAVIQAGDELTPQSERLQEWRSELEIQGLADDVATMFSVEESWLKQSVRTPGELLKELASQLPQAQQREEEHRIEVVHRANGKSHWDALMALSWIRFRDVEKCCRFLERRDALHSLWRGDVLVETDELEQRLASGEAVSSGCVERSRRQGRIDDKHAPEALHNNCGTTHIAGARATLFGRRWSAGQRSRHARWRP